MLRVSLHHVLVRCACHLCPSYCFISYLFSVTTRSNPCTSARWSGMSDCLANPTAHTGYEPNICVHANDEHTQINPPDSNRNLPRNYDAAKVSTTEDPERLQHSGASSNNKLTAASRGPTVFGSLGNCLWKQMADYESVDCRSGIQETRANLDRESVVSTLFKSESKRKRRTGP